MNPNSQRHSPVSVIIPARNEERNIGAAVAAVIAQTGTAVPLELIVVDDGSRDGTAEEARRAGATVIGTQSGETGGNPGAARNHGADRSTGDPIVFLDADCVPDPGWLRALLDTMNDSTCSVVGGAVAMPSGAGMAARCSYYGGCYHMHPRRAAGRVPNHTPCNLAVRRSAFLGTSRFAEGHPVADGHEELQWQAELAGRGETIWFQPDAIVRHQDRDGFRNLLARNYRWGYSAIESKSGRSGVRLSTLYRRPLLLVVAAIPLALPSAAYIVGCWLSLGIWEPLLLSPLLLAARIAYGVGMTVGGARWLRRRGRGSSGRRVRAS